MKADLVLERVAARLRRWSLQFYSTIVTLLGVGVSKHTFARNELDYKSLPLDEEVTKWIGQQFCGRQVVLLADVPSELCASIAKRLNLSSDLRPPVPGSSLANGLTPFLRQEFPDGFVYAGRNATDLDI